MDIKERIALANETAVRNIVDSDPVWIDVMPAKDVINGLGDRTILHAGPYIEYADMVELHKRSMRNAAIIEGWAKDDNEADAMLRAGEIRLDAALNYNTVGAGIGVITPNLQIMVIEDRRTGIRCADIPTEGDMEGGFAAWGRYSPEIRDNLKYLNNEVYPYLSEYLKQSGGIAIKPILAESFQMGDEHHTRQDAAGALLAKKTVTDFAGMPWSQKTIRNVIHYITDTPRLFHPLGMGAARSAMLSNVGLEYSTIVTAFGGNGVEFGMKVAGLGDTWFKIPAPKLKGRYTSSLYTDADAVPWMGDSCVVECAGMGGLAIAASPMVARIQGKTLEEAIQQTRNMQKISAGRNPHFSIPTLGFDTLPVGIDIRLCLKEYIGPVLDGGNFHVNGGLIGAGFLEVPQPIFEDALVAFGNKYL